jgi:hypothetical protein
MAGSKTSKVMWVGRATVFLGGLAVSLALVLGVTPLATRVALALDTTHQAETMTVPGGAILRSDTLASGGKAIELGVNGAVTKSVSGSISKVVVSAKGDQCSGAPQMRVSIDGSVIGTSSVSNTAWSTLTYSSLDIPSGPHTMKIEYINDSRTSWCDRDLHVDYFVLTDKPSAPMNCPLGEFLAEYRNEVKGFITGPVMSRCEGAPINHEWGWGSPGAGVNPDNFTSRYVGRFDFAEAGDYKFDVTTNDGVRVYVDGELLINEWYDHLSSHSATKTLSAGVHEVAVENYEGRNTAKLTVNWTKVTSPAPPPTGEVMAADEFVDRIGVNTHFAFTWDPSYDNYQAIVQMMKDANIRLAREHVYYEPGHPNDAERLMIFRHMVANGIEISCIADDRFAGMNPITSAKIDYINAHSSNACVYFEGRNEPDMQSGWSTSALVAAQQNLFNAVNGSARPAVPVLTPSIVQKANAQAIGTAFDPYADKGNMHPYHQDFHPTFDVLDLRARVDATRAMTPGKPVVSTEDGWDTAPDMQDRSVSQSVQSKYSLRNLFWSLFEADFERVILYEMVDESVSKGFDNEGSYGLVRADLSPKPAYTSLKRLTTLLAEPNAPAFIPQGLSYSLSGSTANVKAYVLQKATGTHYLVLYQDVPVWNTIINLEIFNPEASVRVNLASPASRVLVHKPHSSATPVADHAGPISTVDVSVPDHPVVLEIAH